MSSSRLRLSCVGGVGSPELGMGCAGAPSAAYGRGRPGRGGKGSVGRHTRSRPGVGPELAAPVGVAKNFVGNDSWSCHGSAEVGVAVGFGS